MSLWISHFYSIFRVKKTACLHVVHCINRVVYYYFGLYKGYLGNIAVSEKDFFGCLKTPVLMGDTSYTQMCDCGKGTSRQT